MAAAGARVPAVSNGRPPAFDLLRCRRVLAVQPHYDDNDIGCAGTIRLLAVSGAEVVYVTVTDDLAGVLDPHMPDAEASAGLLAEQRRAAEMLGVAALEQLGWPDAGGLEHVALRNQVIALIRKYRPEVVLTVDPWLAHEAHRDHVCTGLAVSEAVLLSDLPRIARDAGHPPWAVGHIAYYDTDDGNVTIDTSAVQTERHAVLDHRGAGGAETGRCLHKVCATFGDYLAGADFFSPRQEASLQNDLHSAVIRRLNHFVKLAEDVFVVAVLEFADVEDYIDFVRPVVHGSLGFEPFCVHVHRAERESHHAGNFYISVLQQVARLRHARAIHTHAVKAMLPGFGAQTFDVSGGSFGFEQGMVDVSSKLYWRQGMLTHGQDRSKAARECKRGWPL